MFRSHVAYLCQPSPGTTATSDGKRTNKLAIDREYAPSGNRLQQIKIEITLREMCRREVRKRRHPERRMSMQLPLEIGRGSAVRRHSNPSFYFWSTLSAESVYSNKTNHITCRERWPGLFGDTFMRNN